jgi:SAM-dependent methyltransferase
MVVGVGSSHKARCNMALFDEFARDYDKGHEDTIKLSGFGTDYFYEYKIREIHRILSETKQKKPLSILDFGCGVGNVDPYIRKYFPDSKIYGMDVSEESIKVANENHGEFDISYAAFDADKVENPFNVLFDLVFVSCVFHHIPKNGHKETLSFLRSCMNPDALLFVFEHNPYNPATRMIFNKHDKPLDENANMIYPGYIKKLMRSSGFKVVSLNYTIFFPRQLAVFMPLERFMVAIPFGAQYYIVAKGTP